MISHLNSYDDLNIIISGGVNKVTDAFYYRSLCRNQSVIGQASKVLTHAEMGVDSLKKYITDFCDQLNLCENYLRVN